jgi:hypothetical protein
MIKERLTRAELVHRRRKMAAMRKNGVSDTFIAKQFDMSKQRVGQILGPKKPNGKPRASA